MSTVTVDLPERSLRALQVLAEAEHVSGAELAGRVFAGYVATHSVECGGIETEDEDRKAMDAAFGLWADRGEDGLEYQLRMRAEWPD